MANFYEPNGQVFLCRSPLNINSPNQYYPYNWDSNSQFIYFRSLVPSNQFIFTDFTYQRKDNIIRVPINAEILYSYGINYCFYSNRHYSNKYFYCYIERIEFINENMTALHIKTDVFQTWLFEMEIKPSFIERETVLNDDMFKHTLPENLTIGDLSKESNFDITENKLSATSQSEFANNYYCLVMCSDVVLNLGDYLIGMDTFSGGSVNGCYMYASTLDDFAYMIKVITDAGKRESIVCCVSIPKAFVTFNDLSGGGGPPTPPVPPITATYLGSPFATNFTISQEFTYGDHYGIDMYSVNDDVYATTNGTIVFAGWNTGGYGNLVVIESTQYQGYYFIYGHLDSYSVSTGQTVNVGDNIGVEGSTGRVYPAGAVHLHYEVTTSYGTADWNAGAVNPASTEFGASYTNTLGYK